MSECRYNGHNDGKNINENEIEMSMPKRKSKWNMSYFENMNIKNESDDIKIGDNRSIYKDHKKIINYLYSVIHKYINVHEGLCRVNDLTLECEPVDIYKFDIGVLSDVKKIKRDIDVPFDWIISLISKNCLRDSINKKISLYKEKGVKEYWVIDLRKRNVTVYILEEDTSHIYRLNQDIKVSVFDDLYITLKELI